MNPIRFGWPDFDEFENEITTKQRHKLNDFFGNSNKRLAGIVVGIEAMKEEKCEKKKQIVSNRGEVESINWFVCTKQIVMDRFKWHILMPDARSHFECEREKEKERN